MIFFRLFLILLVFTSFAHQAEAARLYFDPEESTVGHAEPFLVGLLIDSDTPINALSVTVNLPPNMSVVEFSNADSVINYWPDQPFYNDNNRTLKFSGVIPGGFSGKGARLGVIKIQADKPGVSILSYDKEETVAYVNGPNGDREPLTLPSFDLRVVTGKQNLNEVIPDSEPPEIFRPEISRFPDLSGSWHVIFQSQDKGSGIDFYEVGEVKSRVKNLDSLEWTKTSSPFSLVDQELRSYVYVRAVDKSGNQRVQIIEPINKRSWLVYNFQYIITIVILGFLFYLFPKYAKKFSRN